MQEQINRMRMKSFCNTSSEFIHAVCVCVFAEVISRLGLRPVQQRSTLSLGGPNMFSRAYIRQNKQLDEEQVFSTAVLCEGTHTGVCCFKTYHCQTTPQIPALNSLTVQYAVCVCVLPDSCT